MPDAASDPASLVLVAMTNVFALASAVYISASVSGGHVNPAVTFAMAVGGHISVPIALIYWICQMVAAVMACLLLRVTVIGQVYFIFLLILELETLTLTLKLKDSFGS